jgi:hypothetical protein
MTEAIRAWRNKHKFDFAWYRVPAKPARRIGSTTPAMPDDTGDTGRHGQRYQ